jgi:hypothetical protein
MYQEQAIRCKFGGSRLRLGVSQRKIGDSCLCPSMAVSKLATYIIDPMHRGKLVDRAAQIRSAYC